VVANPPVIGYRVMATDKGGVDQYRQDFLYRADFNAYEVAHSNADKIERLFPECMVRVTDLTDEDFTH